mmetsp:Transcript_22436/g.25007  ORF Transcript_22436/g.25007 Transcript_22436/m.25007 type:complete len:215 (+) Transcript_22436:51-695(+)
MEVYSVKVQGKTFKLPLEPTATVLALKEAAEATSTKKIKFLKLKGAYLDDGDVVDDVIFDEDGVVLAECANDKINVVYTTGTAEKLPDLPSKAEIVVMLKKKELSEDLVELIDKEVISKDDILKLIEENKLKLTDEDLKKMIEDTKNKDKVAEVTARVGASESGCEKLDPAMLMKLSKEKIIEIIQKRHPKTTPEDLKQFQCLEKQTLIKMAIS